MVSDGHLVHKVGKEIPKSKPPTTILSSPRGDYACILDLGDEAVTMSGTGAELAPSLDVAIRQLLDQQAHIQSRLSVLLAAQHGIDMTAELDMLRHKLRVLEDLVHHHDLAPKIPVLSSAEEARALQYRCECLEAVCLQHDVDVIEPLKRSFSSAPLDFASWVEKHIDLHDSILRSGRESQGRTAIFRPNWMPPIKCWDERCAHYVYGFSSHQQRDTHSLLHQSPAKRDSGFSAETASSLSAVSEQRCLPIIRNRQHSIQLPSVQTGNFPVSSQLPEVSPSMTPKEKDGIPTNHTLFGTYGPRAARRTSIDAEIEPQLPPLKRSRLSQPRLQSIGELQLFRDSEPCLRCKIAKKKCDSSRPCSYCSANSSTGKEEHWAVLGCCRSPLTSFAEMILPRPMSPRQTRTPTTSPVLHRRGINEYLQTACCFPEHLTSMVNSSLDQTDAFWWSAYLDSKHNVDDGMSGFNHDLPSQAPPSLSAIASSWHAQDTAYDIFQLLRLTRLLCDSRQSEEASFPLLYNAKLLLRETIFYALLHPDPNFPIGSTFNQQNLPEGLDLEEQAGLVEECLVRFLLSFELACCSNPTNRPREAVAGFLSVCIFSATCALLLDMAPAATPSSSFQQSLRAATGSSGQNLHGLYRALVQLYCSSGPPLGEGWEGNLTHDESSLYYSINRLIRTEMWAAAGIESSSDFLLRLGDGYVEYLGFNGFLRQRKPNGFTWQPSSTPALRPVREELRSEPAPETSPGLPSWRPGFEDDVPLLHRRTSELGPSRGQETERCRRHTVGEAPAGPGRGPGPGQLESSWKMPDSPSRFRTPYSRTPLRRVYCDKCNEYPEGFRGEHELRRHTDAKHSALARRWVCCEPESARDASLKPVVSLSSCKACMAQKQYGAYYNAAAHLRRAHFSPHRGGKASGDWPSMSVLKDWMREVRKPVDPTQAEYLSGGEDDGDNSAMEVPVSGPGALHERPSASSSSRGYAISPVDDPWRRGSSAQPSQAGARPADNRSQCPHPDCGRVVKDLAAHMLTHQEERPEKCPIATCEYHTKGFARKYDKNRHALTHYRGTMVCPFCPGAGSPYEKVFGRADVFKRHLATAHNVDQTPTNNRSNSLAHLLDGHGSSAAHSGGACCSICGGRFATAQDFYEHLDECVLRVIVPTTTVSTSDAAQGHHSDRGGSVSPLQAEGSSRAI